MSLSSALQVAQNSLRNVSRQTNVVSRNVTNAGNEDYTRRQGTIVGQSIGTRVVSVRNGVDNQLVLASRQALSDSEAQNLISSQLEQLSISLNGIDGNSSPSAMLTNLHESLQTYTASPSNSLLASAAVQNAKDLVSTLNNGTSAIGSFKTSMDTKIEQEVIKLNGLLADFRGVNAEVKQSTIIGQEANDALDSRDALLKEITKIVPVNVITRENNDVVLVTKGGATLFETVPRNITFQPTIAYSPSTQSNPIRIDGVAVMGGEGANTTGSGRLSAMIQMRDNGASKVQSQLDEIARGLITTFAETDASGGGLPPLAGVFTYSGGPALPASGVWEPGLANDIRINALYDPAQGGNASRLRDGGVNGLAYNHNPTGAASYSDHLISLVQSLDATTTFDGQTGIGGSMSILGFAAQSSGWLDGQRSEALQAATSKEALHIRLGEKLSNQTGVNIDEEMALLLELEHSYEASARMISAVDEMLNTLFSIVR